MSTLTYLGDIEFRLRKHLEMGGSLFDKVGLEFSRKYAANALQIKQIREMAARYDITEEEFTMMFVAGINDGMDDDDMTPCVNTLGKGFPVLTAHLIFFEPFRLECLLQTSIQELSNQLPREQRLDHLINATVKMTREMWYVHTNARGKAKFVVNESGSGLPTSSTGCFSLLLAGLGGGALILSIVKIL